MVCPCIAVPLLMGGAVGAAQQVELAYLVLCASLIYIVYALAKRVDAPACGACVYTKPS